ncbi:MAG: DNA starvation/stationary phase protection protein [Veillonellaceae bacterium]|nr:DNA starvation/stationary phase protection protein [Veillonellaceae bacterium]
MKKLNNAKDVNVYLANLALWNIKLHNLHFNVQGSEFKAIHEFLEEIYEEVFEYYDAVAELMKQQGAMPEGSAKAYLEIATLKEIKAKDISIADALKILADDLELIIKQATDLRNAADEDGNFVLVSMLEDHVTFFSKELWFTNAYLA